MFLNTALYVGKERKLENHKVVYFFGE